MRKSKSGLFWSILAILCTITGFLAFIPNPPEIIQTVYLFISPLLLLSIDQASGFITGVKISSRLRLLFLKFDFRRSSDVRVKSLWRLYFTEDNIKKSTYEEFIDKLNISLEVKAQNYSLDISFESDTKFVFRYKRMGDIIIKLNPEIHDIDEGDQKTVMTGNLFFMTDVWSGGFSKLKDFIEEIRIIQKYFLEVLSFLGSYQSFPSELQIRLKNPPNGLLPDYIRNRAEKINLEMKLKEEDERPFKVKFIKDNVIVEAYSLSSDVQKFVEDCFCTYT